MIVPNSQRLFPCPTNYTEVFIVNGRRYFKTHTMCLVSDYGRYGYLPPMGRGFYTKLPVKDFLIAKSEYEKQKDEYEKEPSCYLNKGVPSSLF